MYVFVFDIETIPDIHAGRILCSSITDSSSDEEVFQALKQLRPENPNNPNFLPLYLHQIIAISFVLHSPGRAKIGSLGTKVSSEKELITSFFHTIEKYMPVLVSWNGSAYDLPVLHYRTLLHGIASPLYWENGESGKTAFRYNNYLNRFHYRHLDLMDILAAYQPRAAAPLDTIAQILGLPGKMGIKGSQVWQFFRDDKLDLIRNYCETDVLNTYLIYLRFELIRGKLSESDYEKQLDLLQEKLRKEPKPHFQEFLKKWKKVKL